MTTYRTEDIRNIALVGHGGAGKTTLTEALLYQSGAITQQGSVDKGNTISDFEPEEQRHHHSISSAVVGIDHDGAHINLIDTPGSPDFIGQALSVVPAADAMAVVINAQNGIEPMTRRLLEWAANHNYCRMIVINKIDDEESHPSKLLDEIQETFGKECLPVNLPAKDGGVVDCFFGTEGETAFSSVADMHTALVDQVVEVDEALMELYLEQGEISPQQLHDPLEKALRDGHLIPVCFASARSGEGIDELLNVFSKLMPNPIEGTPHRFLEDDHGKRDWFIPDVKKSEGHVLAHVFKVTYDPFVGKLGMFRIHQGTINKDTMLLVDEGKKPFKVGHLFHIQGKEHIETDTGVPGDICAVAKVDELHLDAILHNSHDEDHLHAPSLDLPQPMAGLALDPKSRGDEQKIAEALERVSAEDPCLQVEHEPSTHETILRGLGELHLRVAMEKIEERYNVKVGTHTPTVAYRETITAPAEGHFRHKKQTGGAGQFGEVFLRIAPLPRGTGFEFENKVVGGVIPGGFIPAVEKGVRQALEQGPLAGHRVQDVKVTVYDGKHHTVDSNEVSFVTAGRKAFLDAFSKAKPILLEPVVAVEVTAPHNSMGDISGDLASRRGRINDTQSLGNGIMRISAQVPLGELDDYSSRIKSMTGGEGTFTMEPLDYEQVPPDLQRRLMAGYKERTVH
ncbi:MAG: elongation factor G [Pseudomonadota bacterium]|nr:MAG: elongation factor G [Pseudomonadota bacterium]